MASDRHLVATAAAWAALVLGVAVVALSLPIDDFWLTLASAQAIAEGADPAHAIPFTWTPVLPGALNPQWGAQLIMGAGGSLAWALVVNSALLAIGLGVTCLRASRRASPGASAIAMILMIGVLAPHLLARAQSFSIALLPLSLLILETAPRRRWLPFAYAALMVAWANLHGGFVIGQVVALAYLGEAVVARLRRRQEPNLGILGLTAAAALVAPLLNPAGIDLLGYAYAQPGLDVVRQISVEWQPAWPWIPVASLFWLYLLLLAVARIARHGSVGLAEAGIGVALAILAAGSIRQIPWFILATAPLLASDVDAWLRRHPRLHRSVGHVAGRLGDRRAFAVVLAAALLSVAFQLVRPVLPAGAARLTPDAPVTMADLLDRELSAQASGPARILNEQVWGGYLAYRLDGRIETAMDGRLEIRDRETWAAYFSLINGDANAAATLAANDVRWAAVSHRRAALTAVLLANGWGIVLDAPDGLLLHRP